MVNKNSVQKLRRLLSSNKGWDVFLSSVKSPLIKWRNYKSIIRKVLLHDPLDPGDPPIYDTDPIAYGYHVPKQGEAPIRLRIDKDLAQVRIQPVQFISYYEFPLSRAALARYDFPTRVATVLANGLNIAEDKALFTTEDAMIADPSYPLSAVNVGGGSTITPDDALEAFGKIEDITDVGSVVTRAERISAARGWGIDIYSPEKRDEILETGQIGKLWNAPVFKSRVAPTSRIYVNGMPEEIGRVPEYPILTNIEVNNVKGGKKELAAITFIGIGIYNERGLIPINFA